MNNGLNISFDLSRVLDIGGIINKEVFPLLNQAVRAVTEQTAVKWQQNVYRAKLWSGEKDQYAAKITWAMTGDFSGVVKSDYKWDQEIENGRPPRDLKKMLDTSLKVRHTQKGTRFLIIPFRHNMSGENAMPPHIYAMAQNLAASMVTGTGQRPSGETVHLSPQTGMTRTGTANFLSNPTSRQHQTVASHSYQWGERLSRSAMKAAGVSAADRKRYDGMVRFDTTTNGAKSSQFLTFRVMSENSKGWIVPAQPGQHLAKSAVDEMQPKANAAFAEAIRRQFGS